MENENQKYTSEPENISTQQNNTELENKIEAVLFYKSEPVQIKTLAKYFNTTREDISLACESLKEKLSERGIRLSEKEDSVALVTSKSTSEIIESIRKEELTKDLSKAALETLSIVLYRSPIKRSEIDYIRGVNSQFILRLLLIRGLIEKTTNPQDERGYLYKPSFELMNLLGINQINEIPEFQKVNDDINEFISNQDENNENEE